MTNLICIVCPKGCHLSVDETNDYKVTGHTCPRGELYGKKELTNPTRVLTSTVKITGGIHPRLPVKTSSDIPKELIYSVMALLNDINLKSPVAVGDVIIKDILGTGVNLVACRNM